MKLWPCVFFLTGCALLPEPEYRCSNERLLEAKEFAQYCMQYTNSGARQCVELAQKFMCSPVEGDRWGR